MISFKEFLTEILDQPYEHYMVNNERQFKGYEFNTGCHKYNVEFAHKSKTPHAEVSFSQLNQSGGGEKLGPTGDMGNKSHRVFSTVHDIIKHHIKNNPHIKTYSMEGIVEGGRVPLYRHLMHRFTNNYKEEQYENKAGEHWRSNFSFHKDDIRNKPNIESF